MLTLFTTNFTINSTCWIILKAFKMSYITICTKHYPVTLLMLYCQLSVGIIGDRVGVESTDDALQHLVVSMKQDVTSQHPIPINKLTETGRNQSCPTFKLADIDVKINNIEIFKAWQVWTHIDMLMKQLPLSQQESHMRV